ncbi:hypothetical protein [Hymenobacter negativus]|uniref:DUF4148 domain-containing protein n=1 Tax=Hymenobacter negativus TaxID=2795026 RepID=A0ABS0Q694_9BACT|nr:MULTISPECIES: hypothetical protein [Bacteria]MBH8558187.1 hypothetical protein [Hymenobacter negativus]MBH8568677.1 hypothetical protein [Hymenobacter negativus]MBR7208411.1 hypothetical protein [Microvirga sp. STS02]
MKKSLFSLLAATSLLAVSYTSVAQVVTPGINARQRNERARIRQGVATGELTRPEAARLKGREAEIRQDKRAARADGIVTRDERQDIRKDENQASRAIYRQKHDGQVRPRAVR